MQSGAGAIREGREKEPVERRAPVERREPGARVGKRSSRRAVGEAPWRVSVPG